MSIKIFILVVIAALITSCGSPWDACEKPNNSKDKTADCLIGMLPSTDHKLSFLSRVSSGYGDEWALEAGRKRLGMELEALEKDSARIPVGLVEAIATLSRYGDQSALAEVETWLRYLGRYSSEEEIAVGLAVLATAIVEAHDLEHVATIEAALQSHAILRDGFLKDLGGGLCYRGDLDLAVEILSNISDEKIKDMENTVLPLCALRDGAIDDALMLIKRFQGKADSLDVRRRLVIEEFVVSSVSHGRDDLLEDVKSWVENNYSSARIDYKKLEAVGVLKKGDLMQGVPALEAYLDNMREEDRSANIHLLSLIELHVAAAEGYMVSGRSKEALEHLSVAIGMDAMLYSRHVSVVDIAKMYVMISDREYDLVVEDFQRSNSLFFSGVYQGAKGLISKGDFNSAYWAATLLVSPQNIDAVLRDVVRAQAERLMLKSASETAELIQHEPFAHQAKIYLVRGLAASGDKGSAIQLSNAISDPLKRAEALFVALHTPLYAGEKPLDLWESKERQKLLGDLKFHQSNISIN